MNKPETAYGSSLSRSPWTVSEAKGRKEAFYLARLWHHYFGVEYEPNSLPHELGEIAGWNDEENSVDVLGTIAYHTPRNRDGTVPIGGGLASILDHRASVEALPEGRFDADALAGERNGWLWLGAVDPSWRGLGIGYEMFRRRVEWAETQGAGMLFGFGWERRDGRTSRPLFEAFDFIPIQRCPDYYAGNRESCPDCGSWPNNDVRCQCEMVLWALDLPRYER